MAEKKTTRKSASDAGRKFAIEAARLAADTNAMDVIVLDLHEVSPVTDYFVICTGTSNRQMRTVADELIRLGKAGTHPVWHAAGLDSPDWICLDFVDVVVHVFSETRRRYYDLELIWGAAPRVRWQRRAAAKKTQEDGQ